MMDSLVKLADGGLLSLGRLAGLPGLQHRLDRAGGVDGQTDRAVGGEAADHDGTGRAKGDEGGGEVDGEVGGLGHNNSFVVGFIIQHVFPAKPKKDRALIKSDEMPANAKMRIRVGFSLELLLGLGAIGETSRRYQR